MEPHLTSLERRHAQLYKLAGCRIHSRCQLAREAIVSPARSWLSATEASSAARTSDAADAE